MSHLLQLLLLLAIVLFTSKYAGYLSLRLGQPAIVGKIALGLLLGPTILDIVNWHIGGFYIFGGVAHELANGAAAAGGPIGGYTGEALLLTFRDMAEIGVLLLMFMAGLETDLAKLMRVGKVALWAAIGGVAAPLLLGIGASWGFSVLGLGFDIYECIFIGTILTATSVSISAQTLMELGRLKSKEGSAILGAAVIDDVVGIIILSFVIAFKPAGPGAAVAPSHLLDWIMLGLSSAGLPEAGAAYMRVGLLVLMMAGFFFIAISAGRWFIRPLLRSMEHLPVTQGLLAGVLIVGLLYAWAAEWIGNVAAITGTFIAGVLLGRTELRQRIEERLHIFTYSFFVPVFFVSIGMEANARPIFAPLVHFGSMSRTEGLLLLFTFVILVLAVLSKVFGCMAGARLAGFDARSSLRVGVGMISRGEVGIIIALVGMSAGIISREVFSVMVLMVLVTTLITPIWLKAVFRSDGADGERVA
ncbi:cation:proton antiporter [bacterium]|nr:cation:proton antiporter [bacterium]